MYSAVETVDARVRAHEAVAAPRAELPMTDGPSARSAGHAEFLARLTSAAAARGDRDLLTLVEADGQTVTFTYPMLLEVAQAWAARYREAGLAPGDRLVVILPHCSALYSAYLGALVGGYCPAFFAPPSEKTAQIDYARSVALLLEQIGAAFVVTTHELRRQLAGEMGWFRGFTEGGALCEIGSGPAWSIDASPSDHLFMQFSSGTTGIKKGVGVTAEALLWQVDAYARQLGLTADARIATWLPLYHDMGLITCFFLPLLLGIPVVAVSPFVWVRQPEILLDIISLARATHCWLPNFAFNFLASRVARKDSQAWALDCVEALINCSEPIHADSHQQFLARFAAHGIRPCMIRTCYAMAETTFAIASSAASEAGPVVETVDSASLNRDQPVRLARSVDSGRVAVGSGRALPDTRIEILSTLDTPLPDGHLGEIAVSMPSLFGGYLNNAEANATAFRNGSFRTGDLGYLRNGELFVIGRIKDTVIIGGKNVYPQDIEAICNEVPGVIPGRCVAFGVDDPDLGTQNLVVIVEVASDDTAIRDKVRRQVFQAIVSRTESTPADILAAPHMWLQKSTSGKISRTRNRELYLKVVAEQAAAPAPKVEAAEVASLVRRLVLEIAGEPIGDDVPLLTEGWIDSFSFVTLVLQVETHFGADIAAALRTNPNRYQTTRRIIDLVEAGGTEPKGHSDTEDAAVGELQADDPRRLLAPQLSDVDRQPFSSVAYLMRRGAAHFQSPSTNTDGLGCRISWRNGQPVDNEAIVGTDRPRGVVLGNSFAFGVGTTHDSLQVASRLNAVGAGGDIVWTNFALRASNLTQERLAFELYAQPPVEQVIWISGINNLITLIIEEGVDPNPAPFIGERGFTLATMPDARLEPPRQTAMERYRDMLRIAEIDISAVALRLGSAGRVTFCLQPSAAWIGKPMSAEETTLIEGFDRHGAAIRHAHHPQYIGKMHATFSRDIKGICDRWGVGFIDLNHSTRLRTSDWLFLDRIHMNDRGHQLVAEEISQFLTQPLDIDKERRTAS